MRRWFELAAVCITLAGCKATEGQPCAKDDDCASLLACQAFSCTSIKELKALADKRKVDLTGCAEKGDLLRLLGIPV